MKQTVPTSVNLPVGFPSLTRSVSASFADRSYTNTSFNFFQSVFPLKTPAERVRPVYHFQRNNFFNDEFRVHILVPEGFNNDITNVPEFANEFSSLSLIAGRQPFFRTQPSTTSVELLSLTTGLCSVRVKNKATGHATHLLSVQI
jgi:hypothetical protein